MRPLSLPLALVCVLVAAVMPDFVTGSTAHAGVIVGNPPLARWFLATGATDASTRSLQAEVIGIELHGCDGSIEARVGRESVDFALGWEPALPDGAWCGLTVHVDGPLVRCDADGCVELWAEAIDFTPEVDDATGDLVMRGVIVGNPPLLALPPR